MLLKLTFRSLGKVSWMFNCKNKLIHEDEIKWRNQPDGYALLSCKNNKVIKHFLKNSNVNEVIRAVLNSLIFFTKRFRALKKTKTCHKPKSANKARIKTSKRMKMVCFAFLCFLCGRRKEKENGAHHGDVSNTDVPTTRFM